LLGTAFGLFVALLAWGDQIRNPRKEITQLEEIFRKEFDLKKSTINPLIRKSYESEESSKKYTFLKQAESMTKILDSQRIKGDNINLLEKVRNSQETRKKLENQYRFRYLFTILMCISLFAFGICSVVAEETENESGLEFNYIYLIITFIFVGILLSNFILTYQTENKFITEINEISDEIEVKE
jgi:uncharacterized tellurite resistance protein B-like protein